MLNKYEAERRADFIAGLKELTALYESIDDLRVPVGTTTACSFARDIETFLKWRKAGGFHEKAGAADDSHHQFSRDIGQTIRIFLFLDKAKTCNRVKVGEKIIPALPPMPAQPERVEEIYRWECPDSLLEFASNGEQKAAV